MANEVAAYRRHVEETVERLGRAHPTVRTQYYSEEVDGEGGMFPPDRLARLRSEETAEETALPGRLYALLLDVAGEDEGVRGMDGILSPANPARDSSALTIVRVALPAEGSPLPRYTPVKRVQWTGVSHTRLHTEIRELALAWQARTVVVDATGVGAGLTSFLERSLPGRVLPFTFNAASKSKLGWDFLGVVDSGRWLEPQLDAERQPEQARCQQEFFEQLASCQFQVSSGPDQRMRWGVPDGTRDPASAQPVHDDWVLSAALCACLEDIDYALPRGLKRAQVEQVRAGEWVQNHRNDKFLDALAANVRATLARFPMEEQAQVLTVFTAHSLPEKILESADPYDRETRATARAVAARANLARNGVHNVSVETADAFAYSDATRYDAVVLTGSLPVYDARFEQWLAVGGRLFVVVGQGPVMEARRMTLDNPGELLREVLFETVVDPLAHAAEPPKFVF